MGDIASRSHKLVAEFLAKQAMEDEITDPDPMNVGNAFLELTTKMMLNPSHAIGSSLDLWQDYLELWQNTANRMLGQETEPVATPSGDDRRFRDAAWSDNAIFDYIKQSYLLTSGWMQTSVKNVEGLDEESSKKVEFMMRQFADALSPTNFIMTNPEVLRETIDSGGENLINGLQNLLSDLEAGNGKLKIKMSDQNDFVVGKDIATSKGKVIFRNELMELIQFAPLTEKVTKTPLLIVPPWINKYYILDLREKNSFVKWASEQGHSVFVISWVNPDEKLAQKQFEDYMLEGPLAAIGAALQATGAEKINMIGYCIGGTLLASTLAYMAQTGDDRVNTATYFASLVDFEKSGDLKVFIDDKQVQALEKTMSERGYLDGGEMAATFNMMKSNDLIWSFVVNNYLMGKEPFPFDLLYWNADSTRMPAAMHSFYLRNMYMQNKLVKKGGISLAGKQLDLRKIKQPSYLVATREDHIAPWQATYAGTQLYTGPVKFVLSGSGHIAGIVNPPAAEKYGYWTNDDTPASPDDWLGGATQHKGSWWGDWDKWIKKNSPKGRVAAHQPGSGELKAICDAPGTYVMMKTDDQ
ncbi:MAG: class I poly(R)-hydroxyalkanoic acid synthase [Rhodospirillales bacterium]|nr:class I poly(R)-hydroxyalkanoic acid synthase [Rhodospirillales bacterium]